MNKLICTLLVLINALFISGSIYAEGFILTSKDVKGQLSVANVLNGFGCDGENTSPKLSWTGTPEGSKSFAVTVRDADALNGKGWWHWVIFDIPQNVRSIGRNAGDSKQAIAPKGSIQSVTSFGKSGYGGACPPEGDPAHQYIFTVYALKVDKLGLDSKAAPGMVQFYLTNNMLAKASIIGYYGR